MSLNVFKKIVHWSLFVVVILYMVSGFGITEYRIVDSLTFGIFSKDTSFNIHLNLEIAFIILFVLHIYFVVFKRKQKYNGKRK